jgi:hypothetical protein
MPCAASSACTFVPSKKQPHAKRLSFSCLPCTTNRGWFTCRRVWLSSSPCAFQATILVGAPPRRYMWHQPPATSDSRSWFVSHLVHTNITFYRGQPGCAQGCTFHEFTPTTTVLCGLFVDDAICAVAIPCGSGMHHDAGHHLHGCIKRWRTRQPSLRQRRLWAK